MYKYLYMKIYIYIYFRPSLSNNYSLQPYQESKDFISLLIAIESLISVINYMAHTTSRQWYHSH